MLHIKANMVRRIVDRSTHSTRYEPNTLRYADGRLLRFRSLRYRREGVTVLTDSGVKSIDFHNIKELHLSQRDVWASYFDELAVLSPHLRDRLMLIQTKSGLIATTSLPRFRPMHYSTRDNPDQWFHLIHPAWSLDAFAVRHSEVKLRSYFQPYEVPLSRIFPVREANTSKIHNAWEARRNHNAYGGPLTSGGKRFGWGWGVHGDSRLDFLLPEIGCTLRAAIGIDDAVRGGGYASPRIHLEGKSRVELFVCDVLRGSRPPTNIKQLEIVAEKGSRHLVLEVDPLNKTHPIGADSLDIRDAVNWLEPILSLDRKALNAELHQRRLQSVFALRGWTLDRHTQESVKLVGVWDAQTRRGTNFRYNMACKESQPFVLSRKLTVPSRDARLLISVCRSPGSPSATLEVLINGIAASKSDIAKRYSGGEEPVPIIVPLDSFSGQTIEAIIRVTNGERPVVLDWRNLSVGTDAQVVAPTKQPISWTAAPIVSSKTEVNKEAHNRLFELNALVDAGALDDASALIVQTPADLVFALVPHAHDQQRTITLGTAFASKIDAKVELRRRIGQKYEALGKLRLSRAVASKGPKMVEAVAIQFTGTPAAAQADAWLGDRALSVGRYPEALRRYQRCLPHLPSSIRSSVQQRIRLAKGKLL